MSCYRRDVMRLAIAAVLFAACVPSQSAVFDPVQREVQRRTGAQVVWKERDSRTSGAVDALLAQPLDRAGVVRIAIAQNRRLQAQYDELGIAASQIADATVLPPAEVDIDHKFATKGDGSETEVEVVQDVLDLLQIGQRRAAATAELDAARARAVGATVALVAQVEQAFDDVVAAQQDRQLVQTAFDAAQASADVVERQHAAGNTTDLALDRELEQRERMRVELTRADQVLSERRARLASLLGLDDQHRAFKIEVQLRDLPEQAPKLDDLDQASLDASLERAALRADEEAADARHRYAVVRSFLPGLGVGVSAARRAGLDWAAGPTLRFALPLFNQQQGPRARARAEQKRARDQLAATTTDLRAEVELARATALAAFTEAKQLRDVVLPLRERILAETVLHYNAMNASTFELLVARREMTDVSRQYVDALRRYWHAMADIEALRRGGMRSMMQEENR